MKSVVIMLLTILGLAMTAQADYPGLVTTYARISISALNASKSDNQAVLPVINNITDDTLCLYTPGDINNDGSVQGADVTYAVRYFKGNGNQPPDSCTNDSVHTTRGNWLYVSADCNGDCNHSGADITRLVAYFKGYAELVYCYLLPPAGDDTSEVIIAGHLAAAAFNAIPAYYINLARTNYRIFYGHTSHGSQIVTGMSLLRDSSSLYDYNNGAGTLQLEEYGDDLGSDGDTSWATITRDRLDQPGNDINMVMWSWCGGASWTSPENIDVYLDTYNQLSQDYPGVVFVFMTGHLDGSGPSGDLYQHNNQIRAYCLANNTVLFDFADVESYDPDGNYYPDDSDACGWCTNWCSSHSCPSCDCAHSECVNCYLKGKAFWWMMARIAGWAGY